MSPIEPRQDNGATFTPAETDSNSGWTFRPWAIAIPLGIVLLLFLAFLGYYFFARKDIARRRAQPDADELPAYRPPLGEGKGGPPAYVQGQGQGQDEVALEPIQGELPRSDQPTEAEEGTDGQPEGEEPSGERASVAAPAPVHVA